MGYAFTLSDARTLVYNALLMEINQELYAAIGRLQVHEMKNFGALQMGVHLFRHPGREAVDGVGQGQFIHLWELKDGAWKIVRVISYDHHPAAP